MSTELPDGSWVIELRQSAGKATEPFRGGSAGDRLRVTGGAQVTLREPYTRGRLWVADLDVPDVPAT